MIYLLAGVLAVLIVTAWFLFDLMILGREIDDENEK